jgi:hypothetical protein
MTDTIDLGIDTRNARIRQPNPAPPGDEWDHYRPASSVHRLRIRRQRRRASSQIRSLG